MMQYVEHSVIGETLIESDRESNKSDDGADLVLKEQPMFVWSQKYEVYHLGLVVACIA